MAENYSICRQIEFIWTSVFCYQSIKGISATWLAWYQAVYAYSVIDLECIYSKNMRWNYHQWHVWITTDLDANSNNVTKKWCYWFLSGWSDAIHFQQTTVWCIYYNLSYMCLLLGMYSAKVKKFFSFLKTSNTVILVFGVQDKCIWTDTFTSIKIFIILLYNGLLVHFMMFYAWYPIDCMINNTTNFGAADVPQLILIEKCQS